MALTLSWAVLGVALLISVVTDVLQRRILDAVTLPALAAVLSLRAVAAGIGDGETGLLSGLLGVALGSVIFGVLALGGRMGWGDVKLMAVVGATFGFPGTVVALVMVSLVGAAQAFVTLVWTGKLRRTLADAGRRWAARLGWTKDGARAESPRIPYALAIALGTACAAYWERTTQVGR